MKCIGVAAIVEHRGWRHTLGMGSWRDIALASAVAAVAVAAVAADAAVAEAAASAFAASAPVALSGLGLLGASVGVQFVLVGRGSWLQKPGLSWVLNLACSCRWFSAGRSSVHSSVHSWAAVEELRLTHKT